MGNPTCAVPDLEALGELARRRDIPFIVDNTFGAAGYLCNPFEWGANIVVDSATKWINGHGTAMGGVIVDGGNYNWANGKFPQIDGPSEGYHGLNLHEAFGPAAFIVKCRVDGLRDLGCCPSPFDSYLMMIGLETLSLRVKHQVESTWKLAEYCRSHPKVERVSFVGFDTHPSHENARKYYRYGSVGGLHRRTQGHARKHRALRRIAPPGGQHDHDRRLDHRRDPSGVDDPQTVERRRPRSGRRHAHAAAHLAGTGKRRRPHRGFRTGFRTNRIMEPQIYIAPGPFELETGHTLPELRIAYHTYGTLNAAKDNVAWVCHALTANSDVADWWPHTVETGRFLDPARHFVVCANIIGSHYGTTGPLHVNPATGRPWYKDFPPFTIRDIVRAHRLLADALGIGRIGTLVGSSVGGFQAVEWAVSESERIERLVLIATAAKASPWAIAIDETQRMAIEADTTFGQPRDDAGMKGLAAARAIGLLSYRGPEGYNLTQQDREERPAVHRACTYQQYQGEKLRRRYNAYSYYAILDAFDTHDAGRGRGGLEQALRSITARTLVVGITTDIIFTPAEMRSLHAMIPGSAYHEIDSPFGHDGFLVEHEQLNDILLPFMNN